MGAITATSAGAVSAVFAYAKSEQQLAAMVSALVAMSGGLSSILADHFERAPSGIKIASAEEYGKLVEMRSALERMGARIARDSLFEIDDEELHNMSKTIDAYAERNRSPVVRMTSTVVRWNSAAMRALRSLGRAFEIIEDRGGRGLAERDPALGRGAAGLLLDGIEPGDALDRLLGDRRGLRRDGRRRTCAGRGPCRRPRGWRRSGRGRRSRHSRRHASSRGSGRDGPSDAAPSGRPRSDTRPPARAAPPQGRSSRA